MVKKNRRYAGSRASAPGTTPTRNEFNPDYGYVRRDLKRIGLLAGSFFGILIILSFFLN